MSGEYISGEYTSVKNGLPPIYGYGTKYQVEQAYYHFEQPMYEKTLSPKQLEKATKEAEELLDKLHAKDKYAINCVPIHIKNYAKLKIQWTKYTQTEYYRAKKDEKYVGYTLIKNKESNKYGTVYTTLTKAKQAAKKLMETNTDIKSVTICKTWENTRHFAFVSAFVKQIPIGAMYFEKIGEMKSMPKKPPKSFIVKPEYAYVFSGCLTDYEYEFM